MNTIPTHGNKDCLNVEKNATLILLEEFKELVCLVESYIQQKVYDDSDR